MSLSTAQLACMMDNLIEMLSEGSSKKSKEREFRKQQKISEIKMKALVERKRKNMVDKTKPFEISLNELI